jgi:hypothetical protein
MKLAILAAFQEIKICIFEASECHLRSPLDSIVALIGEVAELASILGFWGVILVVRERT